MRQPRFDELRLDVERRLREAGLQFGQGTEDAAQEAAWMLIHCLRLPLLESFARLRELRRRPVPQPAVRRLQRLLEQRVRSRRPLAYLLGEAWLQGRRFLADERAIVPRSLIAELLDRGLQRWLAQPPRRIADVCTGGASLAILAAQRWPQAQVAAGDISRPALELARRNVELHALGGRVRLLHSDLLAGFDPGERFDLVLCNPPYVSARSMAALPPEFRHEPRLALAGGADGMDLVRRLLRQAAGHLQPHGVLVLEIGHERRHFEAAFGALPVHWLAVSSGDDAVLAIEAGALAVAR